MEDELKDLAVNFYGKEDFMKLLFRSIEVILSGTESDAETPKDLLAFLMLLLERQYYEDENPIKVALFGVSRSGFLLNLEEWMKHVTLYVKKGLSGMEYLNFMFFCYQLKDALNSDDG